MTTRFTKPRYHRRGLSGDTAELGENMTRLVAAVATTSLLAIVATAFAGDRTPRPTGASKDVRQGILERSEPVIRPPASIPPRGYPHAATPPTSTERHVAEFCGGRSSTPINLGEWRTDVIAERLPNATPPMALFSCLFPRLFLVAGRAYARRRLTGARRAAEPRLRAEI